ncbi:hypothetical protein LY78DRAFT_649984 [Colletotrichum sublineola]|nr:hypothetical protein LY78DRAFT_649984 [Colletotrichum sublineola]
MMLAVLFLNARLSAYIRGRITARRRPSGKTQALTDRASRPARKYPGPGFRLSHGVIDLLPRRDSHKFRAKHGYRSASGG